MSCSWVAQLPADHNSFLKPPVVTTHGTPLIAVEDLNSTLIRKGSILQTNSKFCSTMKVKRKNK